MLDDIRKLNFGKLAAEREIENGLKNYFVETGAFVRLRDGERTILLGNRGSGKSAIVKMLSEYYKQKNYIVVELLPEDYSYEMLQKSSITKEEGEWLKASAYTAAWKYLIYVTAMKA